MTHVIQIDADGPARIAQRLVARLNGEGLLQDHHRSTQAVRYYMERVTEVLADEIHSDAVEATISGAGVRGPRDTTRATEAIAKIAKKVEAGVQPAGRPKKTQAQRDKDLLDGLCDIEDGLSAWEVEFVDSVSRGLTRFGSLTPPQRSKAHELARKHGLSFDVNAVRCQEAWANECTGPACDSCGFCPVHAYEANREDEASCLHCEEEVPRG